MEASLKTGVRHRILEYSMYFSMWLLVILTPLLEGLRQSTPVLDWGAVAHNLRSVAVFFAVFVLYDISFTLLLSRKVKVWVHVATIVVCFGAILVPNPFLHQRHGEVFKGEPHGLIRPDGQRIGDMPPDIKGHPPGPEKPPHERGERRLFEPMLLPPPFGSILLGILMLGFNTVIKLQLRSVKKLQRLKELEKEHVETELAYLRSQISPHFFMNTLNNIHALIDVDKEKAKDTVIELSKLMRFLLYESGQPTIPLAKEVLFLSHFVELMRLRYTQGVEIVLDVPETIAPSIQVPPLLLLPFVENAFKHGISYRELSYVHITLEVKAELLLLTVRNSNHRYRGSDGSNGIGLGNVRKRLQLLFGNRHNLSVRESSEEFAVELMLFIDKTEKKQ